MRNAKLLIFILAGATTAVPSLHADAILQLYSERVRAVEHGGTLPLPGGYYNPTDPTLISSSQTVSEPWTHNGHEDQKVANVANYYSQGGAVNRNRVLSYCSSAPCASDP